jgi:uncharacterized protein
LITLTPKGCGQVGIAYSIQLIYPMVKELKIAPTIKADRINSMDIIRGVSLCGILLMNITGFGLYKAYEDPTNNGGATGLNLTVWWINSMFFEGTMRGMFSMLFGAGILLFTDRSAPNNALVTDLFFRRLMWMVLFGIIHCYLLLWDGEILYCYGIVGMFAFSFRHLHPKQLMIGTTIFLALATLWNVKDYFHNKDAYEAAVAANQAKSSGENLDKNQTEAIAKWEEVVNERKPAPEKVQEEISAMHKGYFSIVKHKEAVNQFMQTTFFYRIGFLDTLAMMLFGMAFLKLGILKAEKSNRFYWLMALIGYSIGLIVNYFESDLLVSSQFSILSIDQSNITYNVGRVANTCGQIAIIMLFIKSALLPFLQKALAAVGQMAFSNYIMQTLICNFILLGYGFALYGTLQRYELYYIVFGVWLLQLIISPIWLKYFRFGPLEWMWRSLTYWEKQPFKKSHGE